MNLKFILIVTFALILTGSIIPSILAIPTPIITQYPEKISIISFIPFTNNTSIEFDLINSGNTTAKSLEIIKHDMLLKPEISFSFLESRINHQKISDIEVPLEILDNNMLKKIKLSINQEVWSEGIYSGKIIVNGSNFKPVPVDINVTYTVLPWLVVLFNTVGIGMALAVGLVLDNRESRWNRVEQYKNTFLSYMHVYLHIIEINEHLSKSIPEPLWKNILRISKRYIKKIEEDVKSANLKLNSENIKWFEKLHTYAEENYIKVGEQGSKKDDVPIKKLTKIIDEITKDSQNKNLRKTIHEIKTGLNNIDASHWDDIKKKILKNVQGEISKAQTKLSILDSDKISESKQSFLPKATHVAKEKMGFLRNVTNKNLTSNKTIWIAITTTVSSLSSVIVVDTFVGYFWINVIIAMGMGFTIYRVQDFQKIFKK